MATVYKATDSKFQADVAIKVLNKEFTHNENIRKRFVAEARNMFRMIHPNVIRVTDLIDDGDLVAFVMEYIEGQTLKAYLESHGRLSDSSIKDFYVQMLQAVAYVHETGMVHRDIKPSNFMITAKGKVKLLDFGIAKNLDVSAAEYTQTGTAQNLGTPMYMSPEQVKSAKDVTVASDIYSLGVVLWQLVTGKKPYDADTLSTFDIQVKIVNEELVPTSTRWDACIMRATQKKPENRYQHVSELLRDIEKGPLNELQPDTTIVNTVVAPAFIPTIDAEATLVDHPVKSTDIHKPVASPPAVIPAKKKSYTVVIVLGIVFAIIAIYAVYVNNRSHSYWAPQTIESSDESVYPDSDTATPSNYDNNNSGYMVDTTAVSTDVYDENAAVVDTMAVDY